MKIRRFWPDRLGNQIVLLLTLALTLEFAASEWLLQRLEHQRIAEQYRSQLARDLVRADALVLNLPKAQRQERLSALWRGPLTFQWQESGPALPSVAAPQSPIWTNVAQQGEVQGLRQLSTAQQGRLLSGQWQLRDGSWMRFSTQSPTFASTLTKRHLVSLLIFLGILALITIVIARHISRPLRQLADQADAGRPMGKVDPTAITALGSYEVRHVARAYGDLQQRMTAAVEERLQGLAALSHDLRTPIARLRLRSARIEDAELRGQMEHDLAEMNRFIDAVLDYLGGPVKEKPQLIDIASLLQTIAHDAQDIGQAVSYRGPSRLEFSVLPVLLHRTLLNLVQNAVTHAGSADIDARLLPVGMEISVEDRGMGIPADQLERLFEPFTRLDPSRNSATGGAGLGLAIVRRNAALMNGRIDLINKDEGGLRAQLWLPRL